MPRDTHRWHLIVVGNEILSGKVVDTNSAVPGARAAAARASRCGASLVIPDELDDDRGRGARHATDRTTYVFTSGGVGPTHDDVTIEGVARGLATERGAPSGDGAASCASYFRRAAQRRAPQDGGRGRGHRARSSTAASAFRRSRSRTSTSCPAFPRSFATKLLALRGALRSSTRSTCASSTTREMESDDRGASQPRPWSSFPSCMLGSYPTAERSRLPGADHARVKDPALRRAGARGAARDRCHPMRWCGRNDEGGGAMGRRCMALAMVMAFVLMALRCAACGQTSGQPRRQIRAAGHGVKLGWGMASVRNNLGYMPGEDDLRARRRPRGGLLAWGFTQAMTSVLTGSPAIRRGGTWAVTPENLGTAASKPAIMFSGPTYQARDRDRRRGPIRTGGREWVGGESVRSLARIKSRSGRRGRRRALLVPAPAATGGVEERQRGRRQSFSKDGGVAHIRYVDDHRPAARERCRRPVWAVEQSCRWSANIKKSELKAAEGNRRPC